MSDLEDDLSAILSFGSSKRADNEETLNYSNDDASSAAQDLGDYNFPIQKQKRMDPNEFKSTNNSDSDNVSGIEISSIMADDKTQKQHYNLLTKNDSSDNFSDILSSIINNSLPNNQETENKRKSVNDSESMSQILSGINSSLSNPVKSGGNSEQYNENSSKEKSNDQSEETDQLDGILSGAFSQHSLRSDNKNNKKGYQRRKSSDDDQDNSADEKVISKRNQPSNDDNQSENSFLSGIISSEKSQPKSQQSSIDIENSEDDENNEYQFITSSKISMSMRPPIHNHNNDDSLSGIISSDLNKSLPKSSELNEKSKNNDTNSLSGIVISDFDDSKSNDGINPNNETSKVLTNSMPINLNNSNIKVSLPNYDSSHSSRNKHKLSSDGLSGILSSSLSVKEPSKSASENSKQSKPEKNQSKGSENLSGVLSSSVNNFGKDYEGSDQQPERKSQDDSNTNEHKENSSTNMSDILSLSNSDVHQIEKKSDSIHNSSSKNSDIVEFSTTTEREQSFNQVNPTIVLPSEMASGSHAQTNLQNTDNMSMIDLSKTAIDQISAISLIEKKETSDDRSVYTSNASDNSSLDFLDQIIADSENEDLENQPTKKKQQTDHKAKPNDNDNKTLEKNEVKSSKEQENKPVNDNDPNESSMFIDFISDSKNNITDDVNASSSNAMKDSDVNISIEYNSDNSNLDSNDDTGFVDDFESNINSVSKSNAQSAIPGSSAVIIEIESQVTESKSENINNDASSVVVDYSSSKGEESFHSEIEDFESIHGGSDQTNNEVVSNTIEFNSNSFHSGIENTKSDLSHNLNENVEIFSTSKTSRIGDEPTKEESSGDKTHISIVSDFLENESTINNQIVDDFIDETSKIDNQKSQARIESDLKASDEEEHESVERNSKSYSESSTSSVHRHHHRHHHSKKDEKKKELKLQRPYAATIRGRHETKIQYQQEYHTTISIPPAKGHRKHSSKNEKVLLFDPPLLSSATLKDVNACYRESLKGTQSKIRLLNQSISSMILTRREKDAQANANQNTDTAITLGGVYQEINKKIMERRTLREKDPNLLHYSSASEF